MSICSNCGAVLEENANFCGACGTPVQKAPIPKTCPTCGSAAAVTDKFCAHCGTQLIPGAAPISEAPAPENTYQPPMTAEPTAPKKPALHIPKKALLFGGIGAGVLVALIVVLVLVFAGSKEEATAFYLKDSEIVSVDPGVRKPKPYTITEDLTNGEYVDDSILTQAASALGGYTALTEDGKRIFYPDEISGDTITLCTREANKPKKDAVMIDSGIHAYAITPDGETVIYLKGSDGLLFRSDLEQSERIASGVENFYVNEDCSTIAYTTADGDYYVLNENDESMRVVNNADSISWISEDLTTVYFMQDNMLCMTTYSTTDEQDITILAYDAATVTAVFETGEVYFIRENTVTSVLSDYVEDDLAAADGAMTEPEKPEYPEKPEEPDWQAFESEEEYEAVYAEYEEALNANKEERKVLKAEYEAALAAYEEKLVRDALRESLRTTPYEYTTYSLCYSDGITESVLTDAIASQWNRSCASDAAVITYCAYDNTELPRFLFSAVTSASDVAAVLYEAQQNMTVSCYAAVGADSTAITSESIRNIGVSDDGSRIFLLTSYSSDTSYGDLYTVDIIDGQIGSASLLDTNVGTRRIFFAEDNRLCYFKYIDTDLVAGDLYIDGEAIDSGVQLYSLTFLEDGSVLYRSDIDFTGSGTLKLYDAEIESLTLADFVSDYLVVSGGRILCLVDEDPEYVTDTLYVWRDDELTFVDDDVLALIPVSDRTVYDLQD